MTDLKAFNYFLLFKTGDAEIRAIENVLSLERVPPIIELTRGRKSKIDKEGAIEKRLRKIETIFQGKTVCFDLTTSSDLSNPTIDKLFDPNGGYEKWIDFLISIKDGGHFKKIIPTIVLAIRDPQLVINLRAQTERLAQNFNTIAYRNNIYDGGCDDDIEIISDIFNREGKELVFIIDNDFISPANYLSNVDTTVSRINRIRNKIKNVSFIVISTSFPRVVSDLTKYDVGEFAVLENDLNHKISNKINDSSIYFGDYGSINPIRLDQVSFSNGWIPRIDVPTQNIIFFYKQRRSGDDSYSQAYINAAKRAIADTRFPRSLECWGTEQIRLCSQGYVPSSSPSFWISVRMNIFINQRMR